jgi:hypothetical protein
MHNGESLSRWSYAQSGSGAMKHYFIGVSCIQCIVAGALTIGRKPIVYRGAV